MNTITYIILTILVALVSHSEVHAQQHQEQYPLVDTLIESFIKQANLPGVSIAVSKDEKIIFTKGYGYADIKNQQLMTPDMQLRTASVAKLITVTALGKLLSEGKINLDAPIQTYVPYIDSQYAHLTLRQLTGHTAGMSHRPKGKAYKKKQYTSIEESTQLMKAPLLFESDTNYQYSTHAFNLVAAAIEGASKTSFENYLKEAVYTPLGMHQTFTENIKQLSPKDAQLYYVDEGKLKKEKLTNASYKLAGAGFRSTPTDLLKMMHGYTNGFITSETKTNMFKSHQLRDGTKTQVGVAWRSSIDAFGLPVIEHAGSWRGTRTVLVHYPKDNLNIAIMINADCPVFIEETAHILAQLFRHKTPESTATTSIDTDISATITFNEKVAKHQGHFSFQNHQGLLQVEDSSFLASTPIYYLGFDTHYAAITPHGILYMSLENTTEAQGNLFLYHNRNSQHPIKNIPFASFVIK